MSRMELNLEEIERQEESPFIEKFEEREKKYSADLVAVAKKAIEDHKKKSGKKDKKSNKVKDGADS